MHAPALIHTPRLRLRRPVAEDAQAIFTTYANDGEVTRYLSWPRHLSLADTHAFIEFSDSEWSSKRAGPYLIELQADASLIGSTGLAIEEIGAATGYVLARHAWRWGYATEALQAMVTLAVQMKLPLLYALCHPDHLASQHVLEKCGFRREVDCNDILVFPNQSMNGIAAPRYTRHLD